MIEAFGKTFNDQARRSDRGFAGFPAIYFRHFDGWENLFTRRGNLRRRAGHGIQRQLGHIRPRDVPNASQRQNNKDQNDVAYMLPHMTVSLNDACDP